MFNYKNEECQLKFNEMTMNTSKFTNIFNESEDLDIIGDKFIKTLNEFSHQCFRKIRIKRKRSKNEIDKIYNNFTRAQLDEFQNTYKKFLKNFQTKLFDSCKLDRACQKDIINIV